MPFDMYVQNQCCCVFAVFRGTSFWKMELWLMQKVQLRCVAIRCFSMFLCFCLHILQQLQLRHRTLHSIWWVVLTQECVLLPLWNLIVALLQWHQGDIDSVKQWHDRYAAVVTPELQKKLMSDISSSLEQVSLCDVKNICGIHETFGPYSWKQISLICIS